MHLHAHMHARTHTCMHACVCVCLPVCLCVYACTDACMHLYVCCHKILTGALIEASRALIGSLAMHTHTPQPRNLHTRPPQLPTHVPAGAVVQAGRAGRPHALGYPQRRHGATRGEAHLLHVCRSCRCRDTYVTHVVCGQVGDAKRTVQEGEQDDDLVGEAATARQAVRMMNDVGGARHLSPWMRTARAIYLCVSVCV